MYTPQKKVREFPVASRDVTTKLSLGGNNVVITELFLPRGRLGSDIPAGDGKLVNLFYGVRSSRMAGSWMGAENGCWTSNKKAGYEMRRTHLTR